MCHRLLGATARRPAGWDSAEMGAGIADANALLAADLGLGEVREAMAAPLDPQEAAALTVKSLVAEILGPEAIVEDSVNWYRYGPEIAAVLLRRRLDAPAGLVRTPAVGPGVSPELARAAANPVLRAGLGLA
jgi:hypothetical protein